MKKAFKPTKYGQWKMEHRIASYYITSTFFGLFMYFGLPLVNCLFHHVEYKLYPFIFIFLFLWVGFSFAFWVQNWFEKQMKKNEKKNEGMDAERMGKMKRKVLLYSLLAATLLMTACFGKKTDYEYHGFLYSDSTMTNPIGGAVLTFVGTQPYYSSDAGYWQLGSAVTDSNGYWQFLHIRSQNSEQQSSAKWSRDADFLMITYNGDTLFWYYDDFKDTLRLYPGCSWDPYGDR